MWFQGEKAGEILRFLTFRLDFNDFHLQQRAFGGHVGVTATPPAHLKGRSGYFFGDAATGTAAAVGAQGGDGSERLAFQGAGSVVSPQRSDSPTFGFHGNDAWTVSDGQAGAGRGAAPAGLGANFAQKPRPSVPGSKYLR
jgi:hypothetical protein